MENNNNNINHHDDIYQTKTEEELDRFTLEYLITNSLYDKIKNSNAYLRLNDVENKKYKKELKFYRHRILDLTKKFIKNKGQLDEFEDESMNEAFKSYSLKMISHFKKTDTIDSFQNNDYIGIEALENILNNNEDEIENKVNLNDDDEKEINLDKANKIMANIKKVPVNLDNFVIKKKNKTNTEEIMPIKKELNLNDPKFKKKGVIQKKNIQEEIKEIKKEENNTSK